jgi:hypothetical protein
MRIGVLFILYLLFWPTLSMAQEASSVMEKMNKAESPQLWDELSEGFEYPLRFLAFGTCQKVADSSQNPNNDLFQISRYSTKFEIRPDLRLTFRRLDLSAKPRMNLEWNAWEDGVKDGDTDWDDDWFVNEWLTRIQVTENLFVSYGRENLQWGPCYLFSPSNPFFRDNGRSNPKQEVPGMDFARLVWLPAMSWTISFIANIDEGRQEYRFFEFDKIYAVKLDYSGQEAYASMILSHQESDRNRLGAFGGWTVTDALLIYGEGTISRGTNALYPVKANNPFGASMEEVDDQDLSLKGTFLAGGSYTLEVGPTLTVEYVYNGTGYSDGEADLYYQLRQAAADAYSLSGPIGDLSRLTLSRTADPKLRFLRRNYIMTQYQQNDIRDVLNLTFRWTRNIDDGSGQFIAIVEYYLGEHIQLFSIGSVNSGSEDTEFGTILDYQWMIGLEYTF